MLGRITQGLAVCKELLVQPVAQFRAGGLRKAGAAASAAIAVEGELAHHQHLAVDGVQTQIHFAVFILEYPQTQGLFCQVAAFLFRILGPYAQQDQKTFADRTDHLTVNGDGGGVYSCQYSAHRNTPF